MEEDDLWAVAFGTEEGPRVVRFATDDPFAHQRDADSGGSSDDGDAVIRDEFVTDYETEVNIRGARGGTFKDQSKMTPEERARVSLMADLGTYDLVNAGSVADAIIRWFSNAPRKDLARVHIPTFVCAWLWAVKHGTSLKGLPTWCRKKEIDELSAATYVAMIGAKARA
jgi:hypothetical protein